MLAQKKRIPGPSGTAFTTLEDPRATHLRQMSRDLGLWRAAIRKWFEMSQKIEDFVKKLRKSSTPNVDFYSASTYHNAPASMWNLFHADLRGFRGVGGWTAHVHRTTRR